MNERFPDPNAHTEHPPAYGQPELQPGQAESEDIREVEHRTNPQIYVTKGMPLRAELTTGTWLDMARPPQDIYAELYAVLGTEEDAGVDRFYIWDYRGFGSFQVTTGAIGLEGVDSVEILAQIAHGIAEHGQAFAAWTSAHEDDPASLDRFESAYKGWYASLAAYARHLLEPLHLEEHPRRAVPDVLKGYITVDYAALGDAMISEGDIIAVPADQGGVWVFDEGT
ncbi:antirestriction protein ArdA [Nocardia huaxiensis]|uniref:Antirestriction protein ArdA n=1 Tax=Nocardia huaxiensis TaxID=2755382 RepID=A0A7D6ZLS7_9NOCA|nr:antirestriction protein ArdA [Nocardia huaxiensis]QLY30423.1 antirestriction protein ArdA [Nocardia huaxiensis]